MTTPNALRFPNLSDFPFQFDLADDQVHVWYARLGNDQDPCLRWLSVDERERSGRIGALESRRQFIAGRKVLRGVLGGYLGQEPGTLEFIHGSHGKPALSMNKLVVPIEFNLSHSGMHLVVALTRGVPVGVDVEAIRPLQRLDLLARRCLSSTERAELEALPEDLRCIGFFRFWVRKESFGKAVGTGIGLGLDRCVTSLEGVPRWITVPPELEPASAWTLAEIPLGEGCCVAATARTAGAEWLYGRITLEDGGIGFEKPKSLRYATPDCVLGNVAVDSAWHPFR
jgi:4'-phosphopantetheinyl transferase